MGSYDNGVGSPLTFSQGQIVMGLVAGRCGPNSTEMIITIDGLNAQEFWLELWHKVSDEKTLLGYARFELAHTRSSQGGDTEGTYQMAQLLPADAPIPDRLVSLGGVLWPSKKIPALLQTYAGLERQFSLKSEGAQTVGDI